VCSPANESLAFTWILLIAARSSQSPDSPYAIEAGDTIVAPRMKMLLLRTVVLARRRKELAESSRPTYQCTLDRDLDAIMVLDSVNQHGKRLRKHYGKVSGFLFTFLEHPDVPPDNDGRERELPPIATYRKVNSGFRLRRGADLFADIRSVIGTVARRGIDTYSGYSRHSARRVIAPGGLRRYHAGVTLGPVCAMTALQIYGQERLMADLIIIAYNTEATAEAARKKLLELQKEYLIELGDAVVAVRQPDGHVKLNQLVSTTAAGAASGGMWGALIGLLFLNPLLGAAVGAGAGALSGRLTDIGIDDNFMKEAAGALTPGQAALCILVRKVTADKVLPAMAAFGGTVLHTSLTTEQEAKLQGSLKA
jgi:uncharacterized membrane protein